MNIVVLRMKKASKQYDLDMDYFIVDSLAQKNLGYKDLFRLVKEKNNPHIVDDTFNRHMKHLVDSGRIAKDAKFAPFYLTEKCKQERKFGSLVLVSPKPKTIESSSSTTQLAIKQIQIHILLLLFKSDSSYKFAIIEELEDFLSRFDLSTSSFLFKSASDALQRSKGEVYRLELVLESNDGKFSINKKRYVSSPKKIKNSVSYVCNIKGIKYPVDSYQSEPFRNMDITQDEIKNTLSLLVNENILQKSVEYRGESIYLATDIQLYDLLSLYNLLYSSCRSTLIRLWNLREPISEEIQWLRKIEGESKVTEYITRVKRERSRRSYYKRQKRITELIKKITNGTQEKKYRERIDGLPRAGEHVITTKEWIEKEYQDTRSNPKYQFIISEIEKFAFPKWYQRIEKKSR